jgi:GAF domain-containing protein
MHVVRAGGSGLTLLDPVRKRLVFRAAIGDGAEGIIGQEVPLKGSRHGLAFATGEVQSATPVYTDLEKKAGTAFRNVLVAPLIAGGEAIGTISAVNKQDRDHFSSQDISAFKLFADLAAEVVRQRCREEILRQGLGGANRTAKNRSLPDLSGEDMELLQLFEGLAALKQTHPALLPGLSHFVKSLGSLSR